MSSIFAKNLCVPVREKTALRSNILSHHCILQNIHPDRQGDVQEDAGVSEDSFDIGALENLALSVEGDLFFENEEAYQAAQGKEHHAHGIDAEGGFGEILHERGQDSAEEIR